MTVVPIDSIKVGARVRQNLGSITDLAVSIDEVGLLHPIVVTEDNSLIAGARRLAAVRSIGWTEVPVTVVESLDALSRALQAERDENTCRLDFSPVEAAEMRSRIVAALKPKAEANRKSNLKAGPTRQLGASGPKVGETRKVAAQATGRSSSTLDKVDAVKRALESPYPQVRSEAKIALKKMERTGKVDAAFRDVQKAEIASIDDGSIAAAKYVAALSKEMARISLTKFDPERVASLINEDHWDALERMREFLNAWFDNVLSRRERTLRRVK